MKLIIKIYVNVDSLRLQRQFSSSWPPGEDKKLYTRNLEFLLFVTRDNDVVDLPIC